ncbi:ribosomal biogenesis factor [Ochotona curzoniae]|uniref:ribosomal biogenesis factor n=1 Tax=Ochotona curzoniae TaxID=130825 RepID=UPI001B34FC29|nr:ribosomal biogenesis factor [Ochotona curzoniae]
MPSSPAGPSPELPGRCKCSWCLWNSSCRRLELKTMAKNKLRGQKCRNVFHIASQNNFKAKNKAKPVTTSLKKINIVNEDKVNRVNKAFINIQKELAHFAKGLSLEPLQKELIPQQSHENEPVNVDEATRLMAQL